MPRHPHITLQQNDIKNNVIIIGDIHGCLDELKELIDKCDYHQSSHTLIFVGDLVNKGPHSADVIRFVRNICDSRTGYCVRGNHDDYMVAVAYKLLPMMRGAAYLNSLSSEDIEWMNALPYTVSIPSLDAIVVHAGLIPGKELHDQLPGDMHSIRNIQVQEDGAYLGSSNDSLGEPWVNFWKKPPHVYFGHDAKRGLQLSEFATGLDTGCVYGKLSPHMR